MFMKILNSIQYQLKLMSKKLHQKELMSQIFEFLESPHNTGASREWLLTFTDCTNARVAREIVAQDVVTFTKYILETTPSQYFREEAAKALRKFFRFCVMKRYMLCWPDDKLPTKPTEDDIQALSNSILRRPASKHVELVKLVRKLKDIDRMTFRKMAVYLTEETKKKHYGSHLCKLYNDPNVR